MFYKDKLVCDLDHCGADDFVTVAEALLEALCDAVLSQRLILHVHHCIVNGRVKFRARLCGDNLHAERVQCGFKLPCSHFHTLFIFRIFGFLCKGTFQVIVNR